MKLAHQLITIAILGGALSAAFGVARASTAAAQQQDVHPETHSEEEEQEASGTAPEEEDRGPKRAWRNSALMIDQSATLWTFTHEGRTYNPTALLLVRLSPRYYVTDNFQIRLSQTMYLEETQSDSTTYNLQPSFWDLYVDAVGTDIVKVGDFTLNAGARVLIPWSIASQANRNFLGVGGTASAAYAFPHVMQGFSISFDASAIYYISDTNVPHLEQPVPCSLAAPTGGDLTSVLAGAPGGGLCDGSGTYSTTAFYVLGGPTFTLSPVKKLSISLSLLFWNSLGRSLGDATLGTNTVATGGVVIPDHSASHWRDLEVMYFSVGYDVATWLNLSLNYFAFTNLLDPQGNWRVPLVGPDQEVSITAMFTLDQLYNAITGETHDPTRSTAHHARAAGLGGML